MISVLEVGLTTWTATILTRTHGGPSLHCPFRVLPLAPSYRAVPETMARVVAAGKEGGRKSE